MVFERIKDYIVEGLDIDGEKVTMDARLKEDLGADSLDAVDLIMRIEEDFNISIDDDAVHKFVTVGDVVAYVESINK